MTTELETSLETERNFISSLFNDPVRGIQSLRKELPDFLEMSFNYFGGRQYAGIFNAICSRVERGLSCELDELAADLLGKVKPTELSAAIDYNPCLKEPVFYGKQIQESFYRRTILKRLQGIIDDEGIPLEEVLSALKELVEEVPKPVQNNLNDSILSLDELLKMDIPERQKLLPWMPEGSLIMIYGPRGLGKTNFILELTKSLACGTTFLKWKVLKPACCLFIDGEMALRDVRQRFTGFLQGKTKVPVYFLSHELFYAQTERDLNLAIFDMQQALQNYIESHPEIKVIVLDNLSCLMRGIKEDKRDDWTTAVLPFLLWLRRRRVAVVLLHHSGKGGDQRGTSSREDALDTVIRLDRMPNTGSTDGTEFRISFTKSRGAYGDDIADIEAKLTLNNSVSTWTWKPVKESNEERLLALIAEGIDNVTDASEAMEVKKPYVSMLKTKLQKEGKLLPGRELKLSNPV